MSDVSMPANEGPKDLSEEAVAEWLIDASGGPSCGAEMMRDSVVRALWTPRARAVLALVERCCVRAVIDYDPMANGDPKLDDVVARVMGKDGAKRGSDTGEARGEVKRG